MLQRKYEEIVNKQGISQVLTSLDDIVGEKTLQSFLEWFSDGEYLWREQIFSPSFHHVNMDWFDEEALDKEASDEEILQSFCGYVGDYQFSQYIKYLVEDEYINIWFKEKDEDLS